MDKALVHSVVVSLEVEDLQGVLGDDDASAVGQELPVLHPRDVVDDRISQALEAGISPQVDHLLRGTNICEKKITSRRMKNGGKCHAVSVTRWAPRAT